MTWWSPAPAPPVWLPASTARPKACASPRPICAAPMLPVAPLPVWVPPKWFDVGLPPFTPATPLPAWKVVRSIRTLPDPVTHPAMLEFPFPFASVPLAFGDVKESPAFFFELRRRAAVRGAV